MHHHARRIVTRGRTGEPTTNSTVIALFAERKVTALEYMSAKKSDKPGDAAADKAGGGKSKCFVCGSKESLVHKHCGLCKSLEHGLANVRSKGLRRA